MKRVRIHGTVLQDYDVIVECDDGEADALLGDDTEFAKGMNRQQLSDALLSIFANHEPKREEADAESVFEVGPDGRPLTTDS